MKPILLAALLASTLLASPARAAERWFADAVHELETTMGAERLRIPLWGLIRFVGGIATRPVGAADWDVAIFERVRNPKLDRPFAWQGLGPEWKPMVRVHAPGRESVAIYVKQEGSWYRVLVATVERHEAVVVKFSMKPDRLAMWVNTVRDWTDDEDRNHGPAD
ncbi:MAG: hypothetical protein J0L64_06985 [Acidobacteria bacterium]|nr:hypothetical protein [Acidobacteriota bacterium]